MLNAPVSVIGRRGLNAVRRVMRFDPLAYLPRGPRRRSRPTLGLVGWYGHGNYGDELFLEVFREHLGGEFDFHSILDPANLTSVAQRLGAGIRDSDAIVIGGGDIVIPWTTSSRYWEARYLRRPVFVAGVGVPTFRAPEPWAVGRLRSFFGDPAVRFIGTRDKESSAWIEANLHPTAPIRIAPDLVCGLTLPPVERPAGQPIFGVAVRNRGEPDDLTQVRLLCERAVELGYRVRRIVLATGRVRALDEVATERLELPDTELIASDDLDVISRAIGECTALASMKFHGVVVATMYGVPVIATMPTAKTRRFMREIGRGDLLSVFNDPALPSVLKGDLAPIPDAVRVALRAGAVAHLAELREAIRATVTVATD